jgi:hypothetical protein
MNVLEAISLLLKRVAKFLHISNAATSGSPNPKESNRIDPGASKTTITTVDPDFTQAQTQEINAAMNVIFDLFGGAGKFFALTGISDLQFIFPKELSCAPSNAVSCYVGNGVIEMSAAAFDPAPLVSGWYIAHEVGHAFDFSCCRGNPRLYRSQALVDHFVPRSWWQRLLGLPAGSVAGNVGCQSEKWTEIAKESGASIRGQLNSAEDFADTFAVIYAVTLTKGGLPYRSFISPWRYEKVKEMIQGGSQPARSC